MRSVGTDSYATLLSTLFADLIHGSLDPKGRTDILNQATPVFSHRSTAFRPPRPP
jgi:hypothetical protein